MKEEKYIQSLFERARHEDPQFSYEEASQNFDESLNSGIAEGMKNWFLNRIYLNLFLVIAACSILSFALIFTIKPTEKLASTITQKEEVTSLAIENIEIVDDIKEVNNKPKKTSLESNAIDSNKKEVILKEQKSSEDLLDNKEKLKKEKVENQNFETELGKKISNEVVFEKPSETFTNAPKEKEIQHKKN